MDAVDQVARVQGLGLAGAGPAAADVDAGDGSVRGAHDGRTGLPPPAATTVVTDEEAGDVGQ